MADHQPTSFELAVAAERLEKRMGELSADIGTLRTYGQDNRRLIKAAIAGAVILAVVVVVLAGLWKRTADTADRADEATSAAAQALRAQQITCEASNEARGLNRQLWGYVLTEAAKANPDADTAQLERFRAVITKTFADRDCAAAVPTPVATPAPTGH